MILAMLITAMVRNENFGRLFYLKSNSSANWVFLDFSGHVMAVHGPRTSLSTKRMCSYVAITHEKMHNG